MLAFLSATLSLKVLLWGGIFDGSGFVAIFGTSEDQKNDDFQKVDF